MTNQKRNDGRFKRGDPRINRLGRKDVKKGEIRYSDLLRRYMKMSPVELRKFIGPPEKINMRSDCTNIEITAAIAVERAKTSKDPRLLENMLDRLYGRPTQTIDQHTTNEDKKLDITVTVVDEVKPDAANEAQSQTP